MEADEIQRKLPRLDSLGDQKRNMDGGGAVDLSGISGKFYGWPSSRIVRVSRASGGKDRHSKVLTSKGLRDRRVRLSVNTAIQFYDLQDRLGVDQPSKALEWLLKAAASSITELPPMSTLFPDTPKQENDEKRSSAGGGTGQLGSGSVDKMDSGASPDPSTTHQQLAKCSACSSNSETNTCFGLSLPRSDSRAMELVAEKEKENKSLNHISRTTSFTALLSGGTTTSPNSCSGGTTNTNESRLSQKSPPRQWSSSAPIDYFGGFSCAPAAVLSRPAANPLFSMNHHQQPEFQQFSIFPDQLLFPVVNAAARGDHSGSSEYNFNFKVSSGSSSSLSGFNRGTLQSNSSSPSLPQLQRFPAMDGSSPPGFYVGTVENHHQFLSQLCYDAHPDGRHSDQKSKGKN